MKASSQEKQDPRPVFDALNNVSFTDDPAVSRAADKVMGIVDAETVGLFRKYGLPLPVRLGGQSWE